MSDFYRICVDTKKKDRIVIYPKFLVKKSKDLMIKGKSFYAIWDEDTKLWSTNEYRAYEIIDNDIRKMYEDYLERVLDGGCYPAYLWDADSGSVDKWIKYTTKQTADSYHKLDNKVIFANQETKREDYATKKLPYALEKGPIDAYEELMSTLYAPAERDKLEWAIGAIISGDSKHIQKFIVLYGSAGSGKSTVLNIIQKLFEGYYSIFDAKSLGSSNAQFALESLKNNPLVAIQHDGDLSRIEDNTRLNSVVSHEEMEINEKFKSAYSSKFDTFLFMGTNRPVKITEAKSGIIRRLIDVRPSGEKIPYSKYLKLMKKIDFELGGIAWHCLEKYKSMGEDYYGDYIPGGMMSATNDMYSFVEDNYEIFSKEDEIELKTAWRMYKDYCQEAMVAYPMSMRAFKSEIANYFREWRERGQNSKGERVRNLYVGFRKEKFNYVFEAIAAEDNSDEAASWLKLNGKKNPLDDILKDCPAQLASSNDTPMKKWADVDTTLKDIDVGKVHYVMPPSNMVVIDFDLKDEEGNKSFERNLKAASKWPKTYAEVSKGGAGIHLHYFYGGDISKLSVIYDEDIEVKTFTGNSSLRRKETKFNELPIADINSGLPMKGASKMVNFEGLKNEKAIRTLIKNCLDKTHHGATAPEVDLIYATLERAYSDGLKYDVTDLRPKIMAFANNSTNQAEKCIKLVMKMKFKSEEPSEMADAKNDILVFFDVEVFPNLFVVVYKALDKEPVKLINPERSEIERLVEYKLVGFNNRRYDNHILYAWLIGYSNEELYKLSKRIIEGSKNAMFGEAYNLSYTDVYDFCSKKQSLKKWEIELDIHHQELGLDWNSPVDEKLWPLVADYCVNDVVATEAVWKKRQADFVAREILADIAGGTVNDTTNSLTTKFIFGSERHPKLVYTDLATGESTDGTYAENNKFEGYSYDNGKNMFMDEDVGKGGYVYAEPGMYGNVALLDVASMHPHSILAMNCFGEYTKKFEEILDARIAIKHKDFKKARKMMGGALSPYLDDESKAKDLAQALKIAINSVYGLTSAQFDNPFRDIRNKNNIVALRGALFMVLLKHMVQDEGYVVAHIKTDSIKIPDADMNIINKVMEFGKKYGYTFEHEATYDRMCLVNNAVYIARYSVPEACEKLYGYVPDDILKHPGEWTATGTQFDVPYTFKTLFSKEPIVFKDVCETKTVTTALYLDLNEGLKEGEHNYQFVGRAGSFCPVLPGKGGGLLMREKDGKYNAAGGTKGYRWLEAEVVKEKKDPMSYIDHSYYKKMVDTAVSDISQYGDFEWFVSEELYKGELETRLPF